MNGDKLDTKMENNNEPRQFIPDEKLDDIQNKIDEMNLRLFGGWKPNDGWNNDVPVELRMSSILGMLDTMGKKVNRIIVVQRWIYRLLALVLIVVAMLITKLWLNI